MEWIWDDENNRTNRRDHNGLSFETARLVFDPLAASRPDQNPDGDRWQTVGLVGSVAIFVVHTWPDGGNNAKGRIITRTPVLTQEQTDELAVLSALPDDQINTRDIPEQRDWSDARRGMFFRPVKKQLTLRLDADLVDWFKTRAANGEGYQTNINSALREFVLQHDRSAGKRGSPPLPNRAARLAKGKGNRTTERV